MCVCVYMPVCVDMSVFAYFYLSLWPAFVVATLAHALVIDYLHGNSDVEELLFFIIESWLPKQHSSIKKEKIRL